MKPVVLMILDGWGINEEYDKGNAIKQAQTPNFDELINNYPQTALNCSGEYVGLPEGQMGNSEVGHLNIGAGRIVYQELTRINKAIKEGTIQDNPVLLEALAKTKTHDKALHFMGLLSDGGVHSHINHLLALVDLAKEKGLTKVYVHCFLDGRDVAPNSGIKYINFLESYLKDLGVGTIATVMGRYYAMDRDKRWERNQLAYEAMVSGEGIKAKNAGEAVQDSYDQGIYDEFVKPVVIVDQEGEAVGRVRPGDTIVFFNFRADRARQITRAFVDEEFIGFKRPGEYLDVNFICMTQYDIDIKAPIAYPPQDLNNTLGEVVSKAGLKQLRIAETEKYAHVTFFFNGGVEEVYPNEDRVLIPSPKVATYDMKPEMSAFEVCEGVINSLLEKKYDFILVNFANPDMVGHTGDLKATIKAIEAVDQCIGRIAKVVRELKGSLIITADHGNAEVMFEGETQKPWTAHTSNPVPLILVDDRLKEITLNKGSLQDVAPTVLKLLGLDKSEEMTGNSLISKT